MKLYLKISLTGVLNILRTVPPFVTALGFRLMTVPYVPTNTKLFCAVCNYTEKQILQRAIRIQKRKLGLSTLFSEENTIQCSVF